MAGNSNLLVQLATPAIWYPEQLEEDFQEEINLMLTRVNATEAFLKGEVDADFFLNFLHESGIDVFEAAEEWSLDDGIIV